MASQDDRMDDALSEEFYQARAEEVASRVSPKRFEHIEGVARTAELLARTYGADLARARLAGVLHDWDKGYDDETIRERACALGVDAFVGAWVMDHLPAVLHGPTAAEALARAFPQIPDDVIEAIRWHTTARIDMTDLDKIVYIADALEPSRRFAEADELRAGIGVLSLDELYHRVYRLWTLLLIERDRPLHPDTIQIWNAMVAKESDAKKEKSA